MNKKNIFSLIILTFLLSFGLFACGNNGSNSNSNNVGLSNNEMTFGSYTQNGNNKSPIEWIVIDDNGNEITLLSKYILDTVAYDEKGESGEWADCSLRTWLNDTFYNEAFTSDEKNKIVISNNKNPDNDFYEEEIVRGGADTEDKVYILDHNEICKYFNVNKTNKKSFGYEAGTAVTAVATEHAKNATFRGDNLFVDENGKAFFWIRTPGHYSNMASYVDTDGNITMYGYTVESGIIGVRPVVKIKK